MVLHELKVSFSLFFITRSRVFFRKSVDYTLNVIDLYVYIIRANPVDISSPVLALHQLLGSRKNENFFLIWVAPPPLPPDP